MKLRMTFDFDDYTRRALSAVFGDKTPASRERIKGWVEMVIGASLDEIKGDYQSSLDADELAEAEDK